MDKKYFFFDIDGTLSDNGYVPESTKLALKQLRENGHFTAICTGRGSATAWKFLEQYGFDNMICDGGNGFVVNKKLIEVTPLDKQKVINLIDECESKNILWGYTPSYKDEYRQTRTQAFIDFAGDFTKDYKFDIVPDLDPRKEKAIYKTYVACHPGEEKQIEALKQIDWIRFAGDVIFVEPMNKSFGIKKMMNYIGADYKDVVVFGDEKNDLSMFKKEWTCIAMGNAIEQVKQVADYITDDMHEDGIYNACKHFGWI